jgi:hypothetical protein
MTVLVHFLEVNENLGIYLFTKDANQQKESKTIVVGSIPMKGQNVLQDHKQAFLHHPT